MLEKVMGLFPLIGDQQAVNSVLLIIQICSRNTGRGLPSRSAINLHLRRPIGTFEISAKRRHFGFYALLRLIDY